MSTVLLAFVGLAASIARMAQYIEVEQGGLEYLLNSDQQRNSTSDRLNTTSFFYTMLEAGIALIAVNLPSLRIISISTKPGEVVRTTQSYSTNNHDTLTIPKIGKQPSVHFLAVALSGRVCQQSNTLSQAPSIMAIQDWTQASAHFIDNMVYDTDPATNRIVVCHAQSLDGKDTVFTR
ncbi:putative Integral membrane protein [Seiridium cardinale]|uniref:Integral membrane protein n=1 Tax=Seiridium cardinale TaxID=138064 RepID=A0ABR2Y975_9PEZI